YSASRFFTASWKYIYITWSLQCPYLHLVVSTNCLPAKRSYVTKGYQKKGDSNCPSVRISDITDSKTYSPVIKDSGQNVTSNSECVFPLSKNSGLFVNHENQLTVVDPFLSSDDGFSVAARKLRGRRRRGKHNFRASISPLRLDQSGLLQTSSIESVTIQPVSAVVPMMVGRRRGRRGTVRGNVGSGENVDANSMSECSAMKVVETNAVCILTAIDSKLTDRDKEGVSMSVNGDLNSPVSCRSVISPDKENVDANSMSECSAMKVVETNAVCILTAIDSKLTDRDKEGLSFLRHITLNFDCPILPINETASTISLPRNVSAEQHLSVLKTSRSSCSLGSCHQYELYLDPIDNVPTIIGQFSINTTDCFLEPYANVNVNMMQLPTERCLNRVVLEKKETASSDGSVTLDAPVSRHLALSPIPYRCEDDEIEITEGVVLEKKETASSDGSVTLDAPVSRHLALSPIPYRCEDDEIEITEGVVLEKKETASSDGSVTLDAPVSRHLALSPIPYRCEDDEIEITEGVVLEKKETASSDGSVTLDAPVSRHLALSPIPYRCEDDEIEITEGVVLEKKETASSDGSVTLDAPVSRHLALSPIPYRCEDDEIEITEDVVGRLEATDCQQNSSVSLSNLLMLPKGRPSVTFAPIVVYYDSSNETEPRVSVGPIAGDENNATLSDYELSEKSIYQEDSLNKNKENIELCPESTACSSIQMSNYSSPSSSALPIPRVELPWRTPYDCQFLPFKTKRPPTTSFLQSDGHLRRSKRLCVPATHDRNKVVVYEPAKDEYGLVYQKPIGLAVLPDPDEINRRQKFLNRLKCRNNHQQFLKNEKANRARRLQKLAKRYGLLKGKSKTEIDSCIRIQLDPDVEWTSPTETRLPIGTSDASPFQQVIYPENARFSPFEFSTMECSSYVVPALSGAFPSRTQSRLPCFEMDANLTRIVSNEQERRQLHYDPEAINVFKIMSCPPIPMNNNDSSCSLCAVQIAKFAIPLTKPCIVYIPKGIPYKFLNATKENLSICRMRYVLI
ncbi:Aspartate ornithine carbamoyltransferase, partial [Schistosoma japonicum]